MGTGGEGAPVPHCTVSVWAACVPAGGAQVPAAGGSPGRLWLEAGLGHVLAPTAGPSVPPAGLRDARCIFSLLLHVLTCPVIEVRRLCRGARPPAATRSRPGRPGGGTSSPCPEQGRRQAPGAGSQGLGGRASGLQVPWGSRVARGPAVQPITKRRSQSEASLLCLGSRCLPHSGRRPASRRGLAGQPRPLGPEGRTPPPLPVPGASAG